MPSWLSPLLDFLKEPDKQKVIGGRWVGIAAVASAMFAVVKFRAERKKAEKKRASRMSPWDKEPARAVPLRFKDR